MTFKKIISIFILFLFSASFSKVEAISNHNYVVNVLVVGEKGVGKTFLINRLYSGDILGFTNDPHTIENKAPEAIYESYPPIENPATAPIYNYGPFALKFVIREANVRDPNIKKYYKESNVIIPIFDANDLNFKREDLMKWNDEIRAVNPRTYEIYFANKCDLYPGYKNKKDKRLDSLMSCVSSFPHGGFVAGSIKTGELLNRVLVQIIDWGREWGKEVSSFRNECSWGCNVC